jgi:hypothetical protein
MLGVAVYWPVAAALFAFEPLAWGSLGRALLLGMASVFLFEAINFSRRRTA